jgi:hypothetical protein
MIPVLQCLQVIFTFLPRTFSSGIAYLAWQDEQLTFMGFLGHDNGARLGSACLAIVEKYHESIAVAKPASVK